MVTDLYWPLVGGLEHAVRALSHELAARGHTVGVATLAQDTLPARDDDDGVTIFRLGGTAQRHAALFSDSGRRYAPPVPDPEAVRGLAAVSSEFRPHIVHGHNWLARSFLPLKRRRGPRLIVTLHDYGVACAKRSLFLHGVACSGPGAVKCLACSAGHYGTVKGMAIATSNFAASLAETRLVDRYLPVSDATARGNRLAERGAPYDVIPNFHRLEPSDPAAHADLTAQLPDSEFVLFVGALGRHKGVDVLLDAYARLDAAPPLVLIGAAWPSMPPIPPAVTVLHDWPHGAVRVAWMRCALGVIPSVWPEPFGLVALEAMAAGRAVVASRIGGLTDIVADGSTGRLVDPGDPDALAAGITELLAAHGPRAAMGTAARERVSRFAPEAVVPRILAAYDTVLSH
jgi:glycosyltransferase involved in cell wall biosynthesis